MTMDEIVNQVSFMLGLPANKNVEGLDVKQAVLIAFQELKRLIHSSSLIAIIARDSDRADGYILEFPSPMQAMRSHRLEGRYYRCGMPMPESARN